MEFRIFVKRLTIDMFMFLSLLVSVLFFAQQMIPFVNAAIKLNALNMQTFSYIIYTILLVLLPFFFLFHIEKYDKGLVLRVILYSLAGIIIVGTISDLITYRLFLDYTYTEGDTVFVNIMWNMPNLIGVLMSAIIAFLYLRLGKWIRRRRKISLKLFFAVFLCSFIVPFIYTLIVTNALPRETWLEKALFIMTEYILLLVSLSICSTSHSLWKQHVLL